MLNRALIVAIVIVSLCFAGVIGYTIASTDEPPSTPAETPSDINGTQQLEPKPPEVFEKDVKMVWPTLWLTPDESEKEWHRDRLLQGVLKFILEAGNRVEGEVAVWIYNEDGNTTPKDKSFVFAIVLDPHGNIITKNYQATVEGLQEFPWRFSFIAATTGEYGVLVHSGQWMLTPPHGAHLKVTVYDE